MTNKNVFSNQDFYHIQKLVPSHQEWFKGQKHEIGLVYNYFYNGLRNHLGLFNYDYYKNKLIIKEIDEFIGLNETIETDDFKENYFNSLVKIRSLTSLVRDSQIFLRQYIKFIQEEIFEEVRVNHFPSLPSRQKCLFVTTFNEIENWLEIFKGSPYKILKLKLNGYFHRTSGIYIDADTYPLKDFYEKAKSYWSGEILNNNEIEYLFYGKLSIIDEYDSISELKKNMNVQ